MTDELGEMIEEATALDFLCDDEVIDDPMVLPLAYPRSPSLEDEIDIEGSLDSLMARNIDFNENSL